MATRRLELVIAGDSRSAVRALATTDAAAGRTGGRLGGFASKAGLAFAAVGAAAAAAGAAAGIALFKIGEDFDQAYDKIRVGTGATGEALEGLKDSFRNVARDVPASFDDVSTSIADLNTRLGLTGSDLETVSTQMLNLSRITGTDLTGDIESITRVFGDWSISVQDMPSAMDEIYRAAQATGAGVDELATSVTDFGSPLRELGFSFEESLALFGRFEREGVNTSTVMSGMRQAVRNLGSGFAEQETGVSNFGDILAGVRDGTFDLSDAMSVFGARAGTDTFKAIQEGRFDLEELMATITNGSDTINQAARDTESFGEKWQRIKNRVLLALEPVATRVFEAVGDAMDDLGPKVNQLSEWLAENLPPAMERVREISDAVWPRVQAALDAVSSWWQRNGPAVTGALAQFGQAFQAGFEYARVVVERVLGVISNLWDRFGGQWLSHVQTAFEAITQALSGALEIIRGVLQVFTGILTGDWGKAWDGIKAIFSGAWDLIVGVGRAGMNAVSGVIGAGMAAISAVWGYAWRGVRGVFLTIWGAIAGATRRQIDLVKSVIRGGVQAIGRIWDGIKGAMTGPVNWVIDNVINRFLSVMRTVADVVNLGGIIPGPLGHVGGGGGTGGGGGRRLGRQYHSGGIVGETGGRPHLGPLRAGEVPAVLQMGETVVDRSGMVAGRPAADVIAERYGVRSDDELRAMGLPVGGFPNPVSAVAGVVSDAVNAVADRLRELAAGGLARLLSPIRNSITDAGGRFGTPGRIFAGMVTEPMDALLLWVAGASNEADKRAIPRNFGPGMIWQQLWNVVHHQFPWAQLHSGFRPGAITATGNQSLHSRGRAIDITPSMDIFNWLASNYPNSGELIFSPANARQIYRGRPHMYGEPTRGDHFDHIHWGMFDRGGYLAPGWNMAYNGTGRPEPVGPAATRTVEVNVTVQGSVLSDRDLVAAIDKALRSGTAAPELRRFIQRLSN